MSTLQLSAPRATTRTRKIKNREQVATERVPAERVREMLLEIAYVLHATRVVARREPRAAFPRQES